MSSSKTLCTFSPIYAFTPLRAAMEQVVGVAFERFAKIGMRDRDHPPRPLLERLPAQFGSAELGHDNVGVAARGRNRTCHMRDDLADFPVARSRGKRDNRAASARELRPAHEVDLSANRADVNPAGDLGADRARQIDLDRRIDRDISSQLRKYRGVVNMRKRMEANLRVHTPEIVELLSPEQRAAN